MSSYYSIFTTVTCFSVFLHHLHGPHSIFIHHFSNCTALVLLKDICHEDTKIESYFHVKLSALSVAILPPLSNKHLRLPRSLPSPLSNSPRGVVFLLLHLFHLFWLSEQLYFHLLILFHFCCTWLTPDICLVILKWTISSIISCSSCKKRFSSTLYISKEPI